MTNVLFQDNGYDRIHVQAFDTEYLIDDTILTAQPGLEGYEIYGDDFIIPVGITMTIEPGVTVMVDDEGFGGAIGVLGSLQAIGTITQPITFTSALNSGPGQWDGVGMGGNVHFDNVVYRYGNGIGVVNMAEGAMAIIENSVIENNASYPIGVEAESLHQLKISNTTFLNNNHNRIVISIDNGSLVDDVILRAYTGLEGYEVYDDYLSDRNLIVPDDITLTLEANVVMMVSEYGSVQVNGRLRTNGTPTQPVTITSAANTGAGEWDGLIFEGGEGDLQYTTVRYGKTNIEVVSDTAVVTLTHTQVVSGLTGLRVEKGVVTAVCATFSQNQNDGIHIFNGGNPAVNIFSSNISGNGGAGLNNESGVLVNARYNWWGDASGPGGLGSGSGDAVWGYVSYEPWLLEPDCLPPLAETAVIYLPFVTMP
jgi:hypothetical protein